MDNSERTPNIITCPRCGWTTRRKHVARHSTCTCRACGNHGEYMGMYWSWDYIGSDDTAPNIERENGNKNKDTSGNELLYWSFKDGKYIVMLCGIQVYATPKFWALRRRFLGLQGQMTQKNEAQD